MMLTRWFFLIILLLFTCPVFSQEALPSPVTTQIAAEVDFKSSGTRIDPNKLVINSSQNPIFPETVVIDDSAVPAEIKRTDFSDRPYFVIASFDYNMSQADYQSIEEKIGKYIVLRGAQKLKGIILKVEAPVQEQETSAVFNLYSRFARYFKNKFPNVLIGGPGFNTVFKDEINGSYSDMAPALQLFLEKCKTGNVPLDLFYIQSDGLIPYGYYARTLYLKEKILPQYKNPLLFTSISDKYSFSPFSLIMKLQSFICCLKSGSDYIAVSDTASLTSLYEIFGEYTYLLTFPAQDKLSFIGAAIKNEETKRVAVLLTSANPSQYILEGKAEPGLEEEYRRYVHAFTDGLYPYNYTRYRINFTALPFKENSIKMTRSNFSQEGMKESDSRVFDSVRDYYMNRSLVSPDVNYILFEAFVNKESDETKSGVTQEDSAEN